MGSSRDWAAKGAALLGTRAVLAAGFERIHRSNLINMGVLPLRLPSGVTPETLGLRVGDLLEVDAEPRFLAPRSPVRVRVGRGGEEIATFEAVAAIETTLEVEVLRAGGLLPMILAKALRRSDAAA